MITIQDLIDSFDEDELAQLTDSDTGEIIDPIKVNKAIEHAEGQVESWLNTIGVVKRSLTGELLYIKATTVPKALIGNTCDVARWYLHKDQITDVVQKRYDEAKSWFMLVIKNPAMLTGVVDGVGNTAMANSGVFVMPLPTPSMWDN